MPKKMEDPAAELARLREENAELRRRLERIVGELRICRFCKHLHEDCSPTGAECDPKWWGL